MIFPIDHIMQILCMGWDSLSDCMTNINNNKNPKQNNVYEYYVTNAMAQKRTLICVCADLNKTYDLNKKPSQGCQLYL